MLLNLIKYTSDLLSEVTHTQTNFNKENVMKYKFSVLLLTLMSTYASADVLGPHTIDSGDFVNIQSTGMSFASVVSNTKIEPSTGATLNAAGTMATCKGPLCTIQVINTSDTDKGMIKVISDGNETEITVLAKKNDLTEPNDDFEQDVIVPFGRIEDTCTELDGIYVKGKVAGLEATALSPLSLVASIGNDKIRINEKLYSENGLSLIQNSMKQSMNKGEDIAVCLDRHTYSIQAIGIWSNNKDS